uniref:Uncharacterized protein n=1 Tax=Malurus cyaneus samueli TaxID=2593467 RepID=A0A8C5U8C6_9PASS
VPGAGFPRGCGPALLTHHPIDGKPGMSEVWEGRWLPLPCFWLMSAGKWGEWEPWLKWSLLYGMSGVSGYKSIKRNRINSTPKSGWKWEQSRSESSPGTRSWVLPTSSHQSHWDVYR